MSLYLLFQKYRQLQNTLNLLKKISPRKFWNMWLVLISYYCARWGGKVTPWGMPISIAIEPTTACNLRCPECPSGLRNFTRPTGMLQEKLFTKIIDELHRQLVSLTFYFQGEPFLNPRFLDWVSYAAKKGIYTSTSTNAHYLDDETARRTVESGLDRLIISIDGTDQDTYAQYRVGGQLNKVLEGTKRLLAWRKKLKSSTPYVVFQFLVVRPNEHQIGELYALAKQLGVDSVGLKTAQIYDYEQGSDLIPLQSRYARYRQQADGTYAIKNKLLNHCWRMWHACVITWDGAVVPCCFDKDAQHVLGDVSQRTFAEVWQSDAYQAFRAALFRSRSEIDICKNCTEGTQVWA